MRVFLRTENRLSQQRSREAKNAAQGEWEQELKGAVALRKLARIRASPDGSY